MHTEKLNDGYGLLYGTTAFAYLLIIGQFAYSYTALSGIYVLYSASYHLFLIALATLICKIVSALFAIRDLIIINKMRIMKSAQQGDAPESRT